MAVYLRQKTTGHVYIFTKALALRRDMEPYDPEVAKKRIEALKNRKADLDAISKDLKEIPKEKIAEVTQNSRIIADLEAEIEIKESALREQAATEDGSEENDLDQTHYVDIVNQPSIKDVLAKERQDRIDEDPEVRKIRLMKDRAEVQQYSLINFGVEVPDGKLKDMKRAVIEKRTEIIFAEKG